ncbi:AAA family ATPase [Phormidium sp. CCY1219]|uniref:AAA family ATPase n=1 Tax=Phormidium sp. CCY1219 TaxID=2886104 RepID=UPI002D1EB7BB|nr:AAA family ATPase [Phormidium sp. CCY1219]MEB3831535.1 AAA family ATPase [Phormidium sp. CCY1219]
MSELFKGFEQLLELAKTLEDKIESGEIRSDVQIRTASNIPPQGNIPRRPRSASRPIVTPPPGGKEDRQGSGETSPHPSDLTQVGGLKEVIRELREVVELPLKRPDLLAKLGLEPPRGVLLVGPPGTGKTLTARSLAHDLGLHYIAIDGPEIMGKFYGEAEARLRQIFQDATASAPCLIFIDELDSLAPDRAKVEGEVEKRVVGQLLGLMDGFSPTRGILLLAATNRPNHLDPALRRPGRFDREIHFPVPNQGERLEILQILTRDMPLEPSVDLTAIAADCVGFVGADLKALSQQAAYLALRRQVPDLTAPLPDHLTITAEDVQQALKTINPSVLRSLEIETPSVSWSDIGGLESVKQTLQESVEGQLLYPEFYQRTGAKAPRGILLAGPPGTGKTLLAKAVAARAKANFIGVSGAELLSRWVGASEQAVRDLFAKARQAAPCVIFIDEIDTVAPARGQNTGDSGVSDRVVGQLLSELDGLHSSANLILIGATNRPTALDPALLRSGRLDLQLTVDLPDRPTRLAILQVHNRDRPVVDVDLDPWATRTENWNGADLALLCDRAALAAIRRARQGGISDPKQIFITSDDFDFAYQTLCEQLNSED